MVYIFNIYMLWLKFGLGLVNIYFLCFNILIVRRYHNLKQKRDSGK